MNNEKSNRKINILGDMLFPIQFQFLGLLLLLGGLVLISQYSYVGPLLILIALIVFTGRDGVIIYPHQKMYKSYRSFLLFKVGRKKAYQDIEKIFINSARYGQKIYTMHTSQHIEKTSIEFNVFVKFNNEKKLYLGHNKDKSKLKNRFQRIAQILNVPLEDNA